MLKEPNDMYVSICLRYNNIRFRHDGISLQRHSYTGVFLGSLEAWPEFVGFLNSFSLQKKESFTNLKHSVVHGCQLN